MISRRGSQSRGTFSSPVSWARYTRTPGRVRSKSNRPSLSHALSISVITERRGGERSFSIPSARVGIPAHPRRRFCGQESLSFLRREIIGHRCTVTIALLVSDSSNVNDEPGQGRPSQGFRRRDYICIAQL